jgi:hypothetical protein
MYSVGTRNYSGEQVLFEQRSTSSDIGGWPLRSRLRLLGGVADDVPLRAAGIEFGVNNYFSKLNSKYFIGLGCKQFESKLIQILRAIVDIAVYSKQRRIERRLKDDRISYPGDGFWE